MERASMAQTQAPQSAPQEVPAVPTPFNPSQLHMEAHKVEAEKTTEFPAGSHVYTPQMECPKVFERNPELDAKALASQGLASNETLLNWITPDGKENPPLNTWVKDAQGHVTKAGDRFSAEYDSKGELTYARIDDKEWIKTGPNAVLESFIGSDGKIHGYPQTDVTEFSVKPWSSNFYGEVDGMDLKVAFGKSGSYSGDSSKIYLSPSHQVTVNSFWNSERVCESLQK